MTVGRVLGTATAVLTVAGCATLVVGMARAGAQKQDAADTTRVATLATAADQSIPAQLPRPAALSPAAAGTPISLGTAPASSSGAPTSTAPGPGGVSPSGSPSASPSATRVVTTPSAHTTTSSPAAQPAPRATSASRTSAPAPRATAKAAPRPAAKATPHAAPKKGVALPLSMSTGSATRVITVRAGNRSATTAVLQAWTKAPGSGWLHYGSAITAHLGSQGLTSSPSESKSATPIGSFSLTRAFGRDSNPGTSLPYVHTTPADWWISQRGPLYNTLQHCSSRCSFNQGSPNEHLFYETPYYNYAVVIDYNTRNAGAVRQGAGSAFFLHVTDGGPTAGCVSIPQSRLLPLMRWLTPGTHPRILIGV